LFVNLGIDNRISNDLLPDDRKERVFADGWDHHGVDLAATLEDPEDGDLAGCATPAFAFANTAKIAFVHLDKPFDRQAGALKTACFEKDDARTGHNAVNCEPRGVLVIL
jgi:hypothetical protein